MEASGEAGGGMVEVRMNGKPEVLQVSIDPALLQRGDAALLEDLVRAACNQALATLQQSTQQSMGSMMQAAGLDLSRLGLGRDEDSPKLG
jgi:DNA-binding YbaB/EbfC family protein